MTGAQAASGVELRFTADAPVLPIGPGFFPVAVVERGWRTATPWRLRHLSFSWEGGGVTCRESSVQDLQARARETALPVPSGFRTPFLETLGILTDVLSGEATPAGAMRTWQELWVLAGHDGTPGAVGAVALMFFGPFVMFSGTLADPCFDGDRPSLPLEALPPSARRVSHPAFCPYLAHLPGTAGSSHCRVAITSASTAHGKISRQSLLPGALRALEKAMTIG